MKLIRIKSAGTLLATKKSISKNSTAIPGLYPRSEPHQVSRESTCNQSTKKSYPKIALQSLDSSPSSEPHPVWWLASADIVSQKSSIPPSVARHYHGHSLGLLAISWSEGLTRENDRDFRTMEYRRVSHSFSRWIVTGSGVLEGNKSPSLSSISPLLFFFLQGPTALQYKNPYTDKGIF
jgi:hypothetical protein